MRANLRHLSSGRGKTKPTNWNSSVCEYEGDLDYSLLFRESFCVAASDIAQETQVPISNLGVLYDDIMQTGTISLEARAKRTFTASSEPDLETGEPISPGKGQLLFVVRQTSKLEASRLINAGYRFATMNQVGEIIARSMQVPISELAAHVDRLRDHCRSTDIEHGSKYLACYALRSKATQKGFDILVPRATPCQLPKVELPLHQLRPWQQIILANFEGKSVKECLQWLDSKVARGANTSEEEDFKDLMFDRISALTQVVGESWFYHAIFCSKPFTVHFNDLSDGSVRQTTIYAFCLIPDVHNCSLKALSDMTYTPLSFFKTRQRVYRDSPDHSSLARQIHHEFAPIIHQMQKEAIARPVPSRSRSKNFWTSFRPDTPGSTSTLRPDNSSEHELVKAPSEPTMQELESLQAPAATSFPFGGILVSSDTTVDTDKSDSMFGVRKLGTTALISAEKSEKESLTFVDYLYNVTSSRFGHNVSSRTSTKALS